MPSRGHKIKDLEAIVKQEMHSYKPVTRRVTWPS
jgi:hypothetical protein